MAEVLPILAREKLDQRVEEGDAEARVYQAAQALPEPWVFLHDLRTLLIEKGQGARDREGDFVVLHPGYGLLVIEVKGGDVIHNEHGWFRKFKGTTKALKDPIEQAVGFKHALIKRLKQDPRWDEVIQYLGTGRMLARHALLFPDVRDTSVICGPAIEPEVVGGHDALNDLKTWVEGAYRFGASQECWRPLQDQGVAIIRGVLFRSFTTDAVLGFKVKEGAQRRLCLTQEQIRVVKTAKRSDRCVVVGGAGTGKTVLALRLAQDFARGERRTLLLGYNRPLVDSLRHDNDRIIQKGEISAEHLSTCTFDSLWNWVFEHVNERANYQREAAQDHRGADIDEVVRPVAMEYALDENPLAERFEVVVIDEGQDFNSHHWAALSSILEQADQVLVFHDANQKVHRKAELPPPVSGWQSLPLTRNCRNTDPIFQGVYSHYKGPPDVESSALEGPEVQKMEKSTLRKQADRIASECARLICNEGVNAQDIAVLMVHSPSKQRAIESISRAFNKKKVPFQEGRYGTADHVLLDTVRKFKGLEAEVVFLWANGSGPPERELLYVGMSRAKYSLVVVSNGAVGPTAPA